MALVYFSGFAWMYWAMTDRSSVTASMSERTALATALKRQELSSGIMRKTMVPCKSGHHISGGSAISSFCFRESESGAAEGLGVLEDGWDELGTCRAAPP